MHSSNFSLSETNDLSQYSDAVYNEAMEKLKNGAKRIVIALPVGGGKTTILTRIAKNLCYDSGRDAIFIVAGKAYEEQIKQWLAEDLPSMTVVTYYLLKMHNFEELINAKIIFVDSLCISDRRELTIRLKNYSGIVISSCHYTFYSQEVEP